MTAPHQMTYYPPNWEARPRVEPWNGHIAREAWLAKDKSDLVSIIELLNSQVTTAKQDALDAGHIADWRVHRALAGVRLAVRIYQHLTRAHRKGRRTARIEELLELGRESGC